MKETDIVQEMQSMWHGLMNSLAVEEDVSAELFADLVAHYDGDSRHYHNLEHIHNVLAAIRRMQSQAQNLAAIRLAAWYHDVIYEIDATDNELRSAEYAKNALRKTLIDDEMLEVVADMIRATDITRDPPDHTDFRILLDADLATLASDYDYYDKNAKAIRKEFAEVPDDEYQVSRREILNRFLERKRIFLTKKMFETSEAKARRNIRREIDSLS
jgi:predicted metal-dependent HD superfamily phosphohydrolase